MNEYYSYIRTPLTASSSFSDTILFQEALSNIRTVASLGLEKKMIHAFKNNLEIPLAQFYLKGLATGFRKGFLGFIESG